MKKTGVPFWPNAMWRDAVVSLIVVIGIVVCAVVFGPPPRQAARPDVDQRQPLARLVLPVLLRRPIHAPANFETWVILGGPLVIILVLLFLPLISNKGERAPSRRPWALATLIFAATSIVILTIYGAKSPWSPDFEAPAPCICHGDGRPTSNCWRSRLLRQGLHLLPRRLRRRRPPRPQSLDHRRPPQRRPT